MMVSRSKTVERKKVASLFNKSGDFPALIVCEHASKHIPEEYENLGLAETELNSHIVWDLGAAEVAYNLSNFLNAPYVQCEVSRLVYDCNRPPEAPDAMPDKSEVFNIPGNRNLHRTQRNDRTERFYIPFKSSVDQTLASFSRTPALITIHSFTPVYEGEPRAVELGILHDSDARLADAMLAAAPAVTSLITKRNEPYSPEDGVTHTLQVHGVSNEIPNVMIEIRNDLLSTSQECKKIADMLSRLIVNALVEIGHVIPETKQEQAS